MSRTHLISLFKCEITPSECNAAVLLRKRSRSYADEKNSCSAPLGAVAAERGF